MNANDKTPRSNRDEAFREAAQQPAKPAFDQVKGDADQEAFATREHASSVSQRSVAKIHYVTTIDDLIEWYYYYAVHQPMVWWKLVSPVVTCAALGLGIFALFAVLLKEPFIFVIGVGVTGPWAMLLSGAFRRQSKRKIRKILEKDEEGTTRDTGPVELELVGEELIARERYREVRLPLRVVQKVGRSRRHTFIIFSVKEGAVIPHDSILQGDLDEFIAALKQRLPADEG